MCRVPRGTMSCPFDMNVGIGEIYGEHRIVVSDGRAEQQRAFSAQA